MTSTAWGIAGLAALAALNSAPYLKRQADARPAPEPQNETSETMTPEQFTAEVARIIAIANDNGMDDGFKLKHLALGSTDAAIKDDVIAVLREQLKAAKEPAKA